MLDSVEEIFSTGLIETGNSGKKIPLHSHTSREQGIFIQSMFDSVKPANTLEVGFAYGISTMFILEKHRENNAVEKAHIVIEPDSYWGNAAIHNIEKEGLTKYLDIRKGYSDMVLTKLFHEDHRIQLAYIDTTKQFDVVFQDFYFIDKILDVGGLIILDDCAWPGVQRVARFIATLPHYEIKAAHNKATYSFKKKIASSVTKLLVRLVPFKSRFYPTINLKTDQELGLNYACIAFKKIAPDKRNWDFDKTF